MYQLKQLIKSRIEDIKHLQSLLKLKTQQPITKQSSINTNLEQQNVNKNQKQMDMDININMDIDSRFQYVMKKRNNQQHRNKKQNYLLMITNVNQFCINQTVMYRLVLQILMAYDCQFIANQKNNNNTKKQININTNINKVDRDKQKFINTIKQNTKDKIYRMLRIFFINNDFKQKIGYLKSVFNKQFNNVLIYLVFIMLSEWSKKIYLTLLTNQIKLLKTSYLRQNFNSNSNGNSNGNNNRRNNLQYIKMLEQPIYKSSQQKQKQKRHHSKYNKSDINTNSKSIQKSLTSFVIALSKQKSKTIITQNDQNYSAITITQHKQPQKYNKQSNKQRKQPQKQQLPKQQFLKPPIIPINNPKLLTIYNRITLYSYIIQQLSQYYKLTGLQQLDNYYIKILPKRRMKQNNILLTQNINSATQVLIQNSTNKQQRNCIKQYIDKYKIYQEQVKKIKIKKLEQKNNKNNNSNNNNNNINNKGSAITNNNSNGNININNNNYNNINSYIKNNKSNRILSNNLPLNQRIGKIGYDENYYNFRNDNKIERDRERDRDRDRIRNSVRDSLLSKDKKYSVQIKSSNNNNIDNNNNNNNNNNDNNNEDDKKYYKQIYNFQIQIPKNYSSSLLTRQLNERQQQIKQKIKKQLTNRSQKQKTKNKKNINLIKFPNINNINNNNINNNINLNKSIQKQQNIKQQLQIHKIRFQTQQDINQCYNYHKYNNRINLQQYQYQYQHQQQQQQQQQQINISITSKKTNSKSNSKSNSKQTTTKNNNNNNNNNNNEHHQNTNQSVKFSQRQTIKGIIVRNFLSNRQKIKNKTVQQQSNSLLKQKSQENIKKANKMISKYQHESKKIMECVDIRSLRQKTKALLYNFKKVQNY